jgi:hypothetical protein
VVAVDVNEQGSHEGGVVGCAAGAGVIERSQCEVCVQLPLDEVVDCGLKILQGVLENVLSRTCGEFRHAVVALARRRQNHRQKVER